MEEVIEYPVSGKKHVVVDIPVGYVHCLENTGKTDLVLLMWASESCDSQRTDSVSAEITIPNS